jgi:Leucine-rich repeat (LRR) protein
MRPGAYRMSSGGVAHFVDDEEDNFTVETSTVPLTDLNFGVSLDARLVEDLPLSSIPPIPNIIDGYNHDHNNNDDNESGRNSRGHDTSSNDQYNGRGYEDECRSTAQSMECGISMTQTATTSAMMSRGEENPSFDKDRNNDRRHFNKRNIACGICILVLVLIVIASIGAVYAITGFGSKKNSNGMDTDSQIIQDDKFPPPVGTPPSITPIDISSPTTSSLPPINRPLETFEEALPDYTKESLQLENSPQSKAMDWMLNYDDIKYYTLPRKLQRFALITLYFSITTVDPSNEILTWLAGLDECMWYDSTCVDNVYTMLSVQSNNTLRGTIVPELALLSSLEYLRLDQNALVGVFPTMLGQMTTLKEIHLNDNLFRGTIPSQFGNLTNLTKINFGNNLLSGVIPNFEKLGNLQSLRLGSNQFSGTLPSYVGQLTSLNELNISENRFTGTVPTEVGYLTSLTSLDLKSNAFEETIPSELGLLTNALSFWLHDNDFTGNVPNDICELTYTYNILQRSNIIVDCDYVVCLCCSCVPK